ncbi:glycosyl hydrolase family 28-related protein [Bacillus sp. JJ1764]|uniref:glycosyl hydrolase family 28-related protein n=1 Tax=Bacillus sp. JJ1764 TaxID=3122964 RepID=UPI003000F964
MIKLDKNHDPRKNAELVNTIRGECLNISEIIEETEELFQKYCKRSPPNGKGKSTPHTITESVFRLFSKHSHVLKPTRIVFDTAGNPCPDWKVVLDQEFIRLTEICLPEVHVTDYGAVGDGRTDCTGAFKKALGNGRVKVLVPEGVFVTKGIQMPSWSILSGAGKGLTTIKLHEDAAKSQRLVTNAHHWKGNHHIFIHSLSLDWNVERLGNVKKTSTFGNHSSCLTFANVTYGWVKDVEAINPGLHCFDISSTQYNYAGDGFRARGSSKYVWFDQLTGYGFGDDGITTHHSDYIFITNSHMCDPSGRAHRKGFSNSNGIEIDDGSRNVMLVNNSSAKCFGGVEIKAHENSSAASNVIIIGHISVNDNRSFNFRHIGHHKRTDPESKSAFNIMAMNLVSFAPVFTDLYQESTPRSLVVSAYKNVVINHLSMIGDSHYDFKGNPIAAIQYRARDVVLSNVSISNFHRASVGIKVFGGENKAESIQIINIKSDQSLQKMIDIGKGNERIHIQCSQEEHAK